MIKAFIFLLFVAPLLPASGGSDLDHSGEGAFRGMTILPPMAIGNQIFTAPYGGGSFVFDLAGKDRKLVATQRWNDEKPEFHHLQGLILYRWK